MGHREGSHRTQVTENGTQNEAAALRAQQGLVVGLVRLLESPAWRACERICAELQDRDPLLNPSHLKSGDTPGVGRSQAGGLREGSAMWPQ